MKWLYLLLCVLTATVLHAKDGVFYMPPQHNFMAQADWDDAANTVYYHDGAAYTRLSGAETQASATLTLTSTLNAGSYALWVRATCVGYVADVDVAAGDATLNAQTWTNGVWTKWTFTSGTSFSSIGFACQKVGENHDYFINGFYLTANTNEGLIAAQPPTHSQTRFFDFTPSGTTNNADFVSRNLLPNSSFELGVTHGWMWGRDGSTAVDYLSSAVVTDDFHSGTKSWKIGNAGGRFILYSPNIRIRNDKVTRNYTLSFWGKCSTGTVSVTMRINHLIANTGETYSEGKTITTTWTRFSKTIALSSVPTPEVKFSLEHVSGASVWVDDVQLEEGGSATTYAPCAAVECALSTNAFYNAATTAPVVSLNTYNTGSSVAKSATVNLYDWMNALVGTTTVGLTCPSGTQAHTISLSGWRSGSHRVLAWMADDPWRDELVASIVPTTTATADTTQMIGIHGSFAQDHAAKTLAYGITWNRSLSPGVFFRWSLIEPTDDAWSWAATDAKVDAAVAGGQTILATIQERTPPAFALSGGLPIQAEFEEYVTAVVNRYKDRITWWEDWNEVSFTYTAAQWAPIMTYVVDAIKAEDASANFVGFGGSWSSTWGTDVWNLLSAGTKAKINAISCHLYPAAYTDDWMKTATDTRMAAWKTLGTTTGKPVWNTESGTWSFGARKSDIVGMMTDGFHPYDHWDSEAMTRGTYISTEASCHSIARSLGNSFARFFYYTGAITDYRIATSDVQPSLYEFDDAIKPDGCAVMWMQSLLNGKAGSAVVLANPGATTTEGYLFSGGGQVVICCFNYDKVSRLFACVKTGVTQYDAMGNVITPEATGFVIGRTHTYWVSSSLTAGQMETLWEGATVSSFADAIAPRVTVESSPHMALYGDQTNVLLRWIAIDNNDIPTDSSPLAVQTRWRLMGKSSTWSAWGTASYVYETGLSNATTYHLEVEAKDIAGNTASAAGPNFGAVLVATPYRLRLSSSVGAQLTR